MKTLDDDFKFDKLYKDNYVDLCNYALKFTTVEVEELVGLSIINLWYNRYTVQEETYKQYLYDSVKTECLNFIRNTKGEAYYELKKIELCIE